MIESKNVDTAFGAREVDAVLDHLDELIGGLNRPGGRDAGPSSGPDLPAAMISNAQAGQLLSGVRVPFSAVQRIAPLRGNRLPDDSEFFPVRCCDLATGGISFLMASRPTFTELVIAFGNPPDVTYLAAEVVHCTDVLAQPSGQWERVGHRMAGADDPSDNTPHVPQSGETPSGETMVQIGCRFTRRMSGEAGGRQEASG